MINGMRATQARYVPVNPQLFLAVAVTTARLNLRTNSHNSLFANINQSPQQFSWCLELPDCARV
jgi:hypothetical protein